MEKIERIKIEESWSLSEYDLDYTPDIYIFLTAINDAIEQIKSEYGNDVPIKFYSQDELIIIRDETEFEYNDRCKKLNDQKDKDLKEYNRLKEKWGL